MHAHNFRIHIARNCRSVAAAACLVVAVASPMSGQQAPRSAGSQGSVPLLRAAPSKDERDKAALTADLITKSVRIDNYAPPPKELLIEFLTGAHTCPADRALVGVEVVNKTKSGETERRQFDGLLIRCDGFVLLPLRMVTRGMSGGREAETQTIHVTLNPGTKDATRVPAELNRFTSTRVEMAVLRLKYTHAPAARTLLPDSLKRGDAVEVVWSDWDDTTGRFGALRHRTVHLAEPPKDATETKAQDIRAGEIRFTEPLSDVPPGAVVVGPEAMALGILPDKAARHDRFISMSVLAGVTGCVVPEPTTDEEFARLQKAAGNGVDEPDPAAAIAADAIRDFTPQPPSPGRSFLAGRGGLFEVLLSQGACDRPGEGDLGGEVPRSGGKARVNDMVTIPGGPVKLPLGILTDYHEMTREMVACVPEFKMDRYKVSNKEYYAFWIALPKKERRKPEVIAAYYPISWATTDPPFPGEIDDTPVLGVPLAGAEAYARSQGKRLPTAYEWCRAAYGPLGDRAMPEWVTRYIADRQDTWRRLVVDHIKQIYPIIANDQRHNTVAEIDNTFRDKGSNRPLSPYYSELPRNFTIPVVSTNERFTAVCKWSAQRVQSEAERLAKTWVDPLYVLPGGSRPYDVSPYGIHDMLLNGNERVASYAELGTAQEFISPSFIQGLLDPSFFADLPDPQSRAWFGNAKRFGPSLVRRDFKTNEDELWQIPLFSRRLFSPSQAVRPMTNLFCPAENEAYVEMCSNILEAKMMIAPIADLRIATISNDTAQCYNWSAGTLDLKLDRLRNLGATEARGQGGVMSAWPWEGQPAGLTKIDWVYNSPGAVIFSWVARINYTGLMGQGRDHVDPVIGHWKGYYFNETPYYDAWDGEPRLMRREMGRAIARDPAVHVGAQPFGEGTVVQPPDVYLLPNGFRCAR